MLKFTSICLIALVGCVMARPGVVSPLAYSAYPAAQIGYSAPFVAPYASSNNAHQIDHAVAYPTYQYAHAAYAAAPAAYAHAPAAYAHAPAAYAAAPAAYAAAPAAYASAPASYAAAPAGYAAAPTAYAAGPATYAAYASPAAYSGAAYASPLFK